jgi:hypothetical protein
MIGTIAGLEAMPAGVRALLRVFDDGIALIDPVTWRTHVLSPQGFALLAELLQVAVADPSIREPADVLHRFAVSAGEVERNDGEQQPHGLLELARIALHLRQDGE